MRLGFLGLIRLPNLLIAAISVLVGYLLADPSPARASFGAFATLAVMLIAAGGNVLNDYFDVEIDRRNRPTRPIPAGQVSPRAALAFALGCFASGVGCSLAIPEPLAWGMAVLCSLLLWQYSVRLKFTPLVGNLVVSLVASATFLMGGIAGGDVRPALVPFGFAALFHLGREIVKDAQDVEGDRLAGASTLPVIRGIAWALRIAAVTFVILVALTPLPFILGLYNIWYLGMVILGVDVVLLLVAMRLWVMGERCPLDRVSLILKADMLVGIVAIWIGARGVQFP